MTQADFNKRADEIKGFSDISHLKVGEVKELLTTAQKIIGYHEQTIRMLKREIKQAKRA